jgi:magnesium and cobalt transporter
LSTEEREGFWGRLRRALQRARRGAPADPGKEIQELVEQAEAQGLIAPGEGEMIDAVLGLAETTAGQIMSPRTQLATVSASADLAEIIRVVVESGHSRIPLHGPDLDHIVGVVLAKDLLAFCANNTQPASLSEIARPPIFVPMAMPINQLLAAFKRQRSHLAVVVDEYGGTAGVVTMEDVLEEIVGDIADEYDQDELLVRPQPDGTLLVDARLEVEELSRRLGEELPRDLPEGRYESVGGLITTLLGRVPAAGEEIRVGTVTLLVQAADERRVIKVSVRPDSPLEA